MGPIFNLIFGIIIFFVMNLAGYTKETNRIFIPEEFKSGTYISPAWQAGMKSGDVIIEIAGKGVSGFSDIQSRVFFSDGGLMRIKAVRDSREMEFSVTPKPDTESGRFTIGVMPAGSGVFVNGIVKESAAFIAGVREKDVIKSADGIALQMPADLSDYIGTRVGKRVEITVQRGNEEKKFFVQPYLSRIFIIAPAEKDKGEIVFEDEEIIKKYLREKKIKINGKLPLSLGDFEKDTGSTGTFELDGRKIRGRLEVRNKARIGVYIGYSPEMVYVKYGIIEAIARSFAEPYEFIVMNLKGIGMLFSGELKVRENLSGPIRIAKIAGDIAYYKGISAFVLLMAKISIILMVMNFLPIPVVDGGHLVFFTVELVRGRPMNEKIMERIQTAGVIILILLGVFVIINDISMLPFIQKLFH